MAVFNMSEFLRKLGLEKPNASPTEFGQDVHREFLNGGFIINDDPIKPFDPTMKWVHNIEVNLNTGEWTGSSWTHGKTPGAGSKAKRKAAERFNDPIHGPWVKTKPLPKQKFKPKGKWVSELHPLFKYSENGKEVMVYAEPGF
jgi:hypothetical protein